MDGQASMSQQFFIPEWLLCGDLTATVMFSGCVQVRNVMIIAIE
jgi:hypothetical protein